MAKIEVERKRSGGLGWLWALLALLLIGLIIWWIWGAMSDDDEIEPVDDVGVVVPVDPVEPVVGVEQEATLVDIGAILDNPQAWVGQTFPTGDVQVAEVVTDRGFWITGTADRNLFGVVIDDPAEQPIDINPQQTLSVTGGTLRDASYIPQIENSLDDTTRDILEDQEIFLVVDENNLEVSAAGEPQPGTDPAQGFGTEGQ